MFNSISGKYDFLNREILFSLFSQLGAPWETVWARFKEDLAARESTRNPLLYDGGYGNVIATKSEFGCLLTLERPWGATQSTF